MQTQDTLNIRGIDTETIDYIKRQSRARGITVGRYVERLVQVNELARKIAESDEDLASRMDTVGMGKLSL